MSTDKGYVKIYRNVWDHWVWADKPFAMGQAWEDLVMLANHEDKTILFNKSPVQVERGSFITSLAKLSERWGWSRHKTRDFLHRLEQENMISLTIREHVSTTITLVNYGLYQDFRNSDGTAREQQRNSSGTGADINNTLINTIENTKKKEPPPKGAFGDDDDDEGWGFE